MAAPTHYEVLGLTPSVSTEEVERRYEELSRLYGSDGAQAPMMRLIEEARRVLANSTLREIYDAGLRASAPTPPPPSPPAKGAEAAVPEVIVNAQRSGSDAIPRPPGMEVTQAVPRPELERTTVVPPPSQDRSAPTENVPDDRVLARELAKRGVAQDEVSRLLSLGSASAPTAAKAARVLPTPPAIPPSEPYVPKPTITLPDMRPSSLEERHRADQMLTGANIARRRGQFAEAEKQCRAALDLVPGDAAALELYGDILQAVGRVDDALYSYERATQADANRKTAEKKYAELMLLQNREIDLLRTEYIPRSQRLAAMLSVVPGLGQIYNGDTQKGLLIILIAAICTYVIGWSPFGLHKGLRGIPAPLALTTIVAVVTYVYSVVDANVSAKRGKASSGWDV